MAPNRKNLHSVLHALSSSNTNLEETIQDSLSIIQQQPKKIFLPLTDPACEEIKDQQQQQKQQGRRQQHADDDDDDVVKPVKVVSSADVAASKNQSNNAASSSSYWDWPTTTADTTDVSSSSTEEVITTTATSSSSSSATDDDTNKEHGSSSPSPVVVDVDGADTKTATDTARITAATTTNTAAADSNIDNIDNYWLEDNVTNTTTTLTNNNNEETDVDVVYYIDYSSRGQLGKGTKTVVRKAVHRSTGKKYAIKSIRKIYQKETDAMKREAILLKQLSSVSGSGGDNNHHHHHHPNSIIKYHDVIENSKSFHLIVELCHGQELYQKVATSAIAAQHQQVVASASASSSKGKQQPTTTTTIVSEEETILYIKQLLEAVAYCHSKGIVHRDLKLENIVHYYDTSSSNKRKNKKKFQKRNIEIRLLDFGLATKLPSSSSSQQQQHNGNNNNYLTEKVGSP